MITKRSITALLFAIYFGLLLINCVYNIPEVDALYYWDWGKHLALSYFDGPPMVAYWMRLSETLLGNHLFSINLIGPAALALETVFVYLTARLITDRRDQAALTALLYAFSPYLLTRTAFFPFNNQPFLVFYTASLYLFCRYLSKQTTGSLYLLGIAIGGLFLSRYNGIILLFSILIMLLSQPALLTKVIRNRHTYAVIALAAIIFSPVLIWNQHHHWLSFHYQMHFHQRPHDPKWLNLKKYVTTYLIGAGLPLVLLITISRVTKTRIINGCPLKRFLLIDIVCTFLFWLYFSRHNFIHNYYAYTSLMGMFILLADVMIRAELKRSLQTLIALFLCFGTAFIGVNVWLITRHGISLSRDQAFQTHHAIGLLYQQLPANAVVFTDDWKTASWLDYQRPKTVTLQALFACGNANEYSQWHQPATSHLAASARPIFFVSTSSYNGCLASLSLQCQASSSVSYQPGNSHFGVYSQVSPRFNVYRCQRSTDRTH